MTKKLLCLTLLLITLTVHATAQTATRDSVARKAIFFFPQGQCSYVERSEYPKIMPFIEWAKATPGIVIKIHGWTDKSSTEAQNNKLSQTRADITRDFLVKHGIPTDRIVEVKGQGAHQNSKSDFAARRVELLGVVNVEQKHEHLVELEIIEDPKPEVKPEPVAVAEPVAQPEPVATPTPDPVVAAAPEATVQPEPVTPTEPAISEDKPATPNTQLETRAPLPRRWYLGLEGGVSMGASTFTSFAAGGLGWTAGIMGGYRISPLLAVELGFNYGNVRLGATECCADYFLGSNGERYLAATRSPEVYSYSDIYSSVSTQTVALRLNIDLLQITRPDWERRWSLIVSPALYGVATTASIKQRDTDITVGDRNTLFQFGAGLGLGTACQLTPNLGLGLRSSALWVFGSPHFDGLPQTDHIDNLIWNSTLTLTWRFDHKK